MIQLIINTTVDIESIRDNSENGLNFQTVRISEMVNGWLILISDKDDFDDIELEIESQGDILIIGSYNMDGSQFIWVNPNSNRNHTIQKYHSKLKPKKVYNESTDLYDDVPYTEQEAISVQVNLIAGHPNRQLE